MRPRNFRFLAVGIVYCVVNIIVVQCIVNEDESNSSEENSSVRCTTVRGSVGSCKRASHCPSDQWTGTYDDICYFGMYELIVCCSNSEHNPRHRRRHSSNDWVWDRLNSVPRDKYFKDKPKKTKKKRISERKFEEYMDNIFFNQTEEADSEGRVAASPGEYPHMSALGWTQESKEIDWKCGGNLISENFVLTAAHCAVVNGVKPDIVQVGDLNLVVNEETVTPQTFEVEMTFMHPMYESSVYYNDIGLVQLKKKAVFTEFVRPACLWSEPYIPQDSLVAMGYGATEFGGVQTKTLTELKLSIMDNAECNQRLPNIPAARFGVLESQICAIDPSGQTDTCQGDSGGPLQLNIPKHGKIYYYLVGITSYGISCGGRYPSVYTRISSFADWIEHIVWPI